MLYKLFNANAPPDNKGWRWDALVIHLTANVYHTAQTTLLYYICTSNGYMLQIILLN